MKRGDVVLVVLKGDYGKPRPAVVIQSDLFSAHPSVAVLPFTSEVDTHAELRVAVSPAAENGLLAPSQLMVDKPHTVVREKVARVVGRLTGRQMTAVDRALALFLGFA